MSEKRFIVEYGENNLPFFADLEEHRDMSIKEVVDLLNSMSEKLNKMSEKIKQFENSINDFTNTVNKFKEEY